MDIDKILLKIIVFRRVNQVIVQVYTVNGRKKNNGEILEDALIHSTEDECLE